VAEEHGRIKSGDNIFFCSFGDPYLIVSGLLYRQRNN